MSDHAVSVVVLGDGRYRALCSCGFKGASVQPERRAMAEAQATEHLRYQEQVASIVRGSR